MKKYIAKILKLFLKNIGSILGKFLSFLSSINRKNISIYCAKLVHASPRKIYFLVYELVAGITQNIYRASDNGVLMFRKMNPGFKMELDVTKKTQRQIYFSKVYEPHVTNYLLKNLKMGDTFIDIGANVGYYTLMASVLVGENGHVVSFEPEKDNFRHLNENIKLNDFDNILSLNKAVARKDGEMMLNINPFNDGGHSIEKFDFYRNDGVVWSTQKTKKRFSGMSFEQDVRVVSLDSFLSRVEFMESTSIIKIDVEGFELEVLRGMKQLLASSNPPEVICEISKKKEEIMDLFTDAGYEVFLPNEFGEEHPAPVVYGKRDYLFKKVYDK